MYHLFLQPANKWRHSGNVSTLLMEKEVAVDLQVNKELERKVQQQAVIPRDRNGHCSMYP